MISGIVFDIREFAIHDGPGIRTTVFLKGCPLSCSWCHNPEGQSPLPQIMHSGTSERLVGQVYTSKELADRLKNQAVVLRTNGGGVTFSGGEPLQQTDFVVEVIEQLNDLHILIDTSGYGDRSDFTRLIKCSNLVYFDLKLMDPALFRTYTGGYQGIVLENLNCLRESGMPFVIRVPLVPGMTDTEENLSAIAAAVRGSSNLLSVDLLPYNRLAGAKYEALNRKFTPGIDGNEELNLSGKAFDRAVIPWRIA